MKNKRLYKSNSDIKLDGVCGGIAEYFEVDPTIVRVAWIVFTCLYGTGLIAYIICMIVIPREPVKGSKK